MVGCVDVPIEQGGDHEVFDVAIVGGGLAGMFAALELGQHGRRCTLIDAALPAAADNLGGFVGFSGAKFSLPPAGLGLLPVAGSQEQLDDTIAKALELLSIPAASQTRSRDKQLNGSLCLREYESIVLTPSQISELISRLDTMVRAKAKVIHGKATRAKKKGGRWVIGVDGNTSPKNQSVVADTIFFAGGRLANDFAKDCGLVQTNAKGLDVGIRLEFSDKLALEHLRDLGPDAKILKEEVRTFCLNYPGTIYYYESNGVMIPGGVVAEQSSTSANVGILRRVPNKQEALENVRNKVREHSEMIANISQKQYSFKHGLLLPDLVGEILGFESSRELQNFLHQLMVEGLVKPVGTFRVHFPLLDWHWATYGTYGSHRTNVPTIYALGDSSGHARGLLQACLSGLLAAREFINAS